MSLARPRPSRWQRQRLWLRALLYELRVEGDSPARQSCAVALGVLIGCTPLYGLHLPLCIALARLFGLNRLKTYLAAHISTPIIMPFLLFAEIQVGRVVRGAPLLAMRTSQLHQDLRFWHWRRGVSDILVGSLIVGVALGALMGLATFILLRRHQKPPAVEALIEATAHRYFDCGLIHTELVRGKLRHDPVYMTLLEEGLFPDEGAVLDVGCGRGIPFSLLLAASAARAQGVYPAGWRSPPEPERLVMHGVEPRAKIASAAQAAVGERAEIVVGDTTALPEGPFQTVVLIDVLHYLDQPTQDRVLRMVAGRLLPGGRLILREADAARGWRFFGVRCAETISAVLRGRWHQRFHYRSAVEWCAALDTLGFGDFATHESRPSGNVLLTATSGLVTGCAVAVEAGAGSALAAARRST